MHAAPHLDTRGARTRTATRRRPTGHPAGTRVNGTSGDNLLNATRTLARALTGTDQWQSLGGAAKALDTDGNADLRSAWLQAREELADDRVGEHEPDLALPRAEYREHAEARIINSLTGTARNYADAFNAADDLLQNAASDMFGQLVCYRIKTMQAQDLEVVPGPQTTIHFTAPEPDAFLTKPGALVWLTDPLSVDAVRITASNLTFQNTGHDQVRMTGEVLLGTAEAWTR